jgi:capsular exopolysaccharide synthesis family protein
MNVDALLETINRGVGDQLAALDMPPPPDAKIATALNSAEDGTSVGVVEFPSHAYRLAHIPRHPRRLFFPEDETTPVPPALEAYRSLRTRILRAQARRQFRTMAITSAAPNEGKTLTSTNLALCCAQLPQFAVLLIDGDLRSHGASRCLEYEDGPGLAEVLSGAASREAAIVATDIPNLHFISAGEATRPPTELLSGAPWVEFITWCRNNFKLVLVDCPPAAHLADFELISASCEKVLVVARARTTRKQAFERMLAQVDSHKLLGISLNDIRHYERSDYYYYESRSKRK